MKRRFLFGVVIMMMLAVVGCGEHEHKYGEYEITTAPTCTEEGVRSRTCSDCGEVATEPIPAQGHNFVDGSCTECGEKE